MIKRFFKFILLLSMVFLLVGLAGGLVYGLRLYILLTRDLPKIDRIGDYRPQAVSVILANDGTQLAEFFEQRRYPENIDQIPQLIQNAFLAAEDANFYHHPGIDFWSVLRAIYVNVRHGAAKQGASTITQQVVRALLPIGREKKLERKAKEAILSYRLEKALTKREIFNIYLNEIFLGNNTYGVKAAARVHFRKELGELSIAEAAFLAGLPQRPSYLMDPKHRDAAISRQHYVLRQLLENRMITQSEYDGAFRQEIKTYMPEVRWMKDTEYYAAHALLEARDRLEKINRRWSPANPGGFTIHTNADISAHRAAVRVLRRGLREVDKRRGWRGPLHVNAPVGNSPAIDVQPIPETVMIPDTVYTAVVTDVAKNGVATVQVGSFSGTLDLTKAAWARRLLGKNEEVQGIDPTRVIKEGSVIEVSLDNDTKDPVPLTEKGKSLRLKLDQTPDIEGAFVLQNALSGAVSVILGGYEYGRSQFNRATQGVRQPGSSFKPFIYLSALDYLHYTPSTIVQDVPVSLVAGNGQLWTPGNFDGKFLGPMTLRTALQKSRNVVSVHLITKIGVDRVIDTAKKLGITTPIGRDLSISLGTSDVKLIDLVHAYGTFAASGYLSDQIVVTKIVDRDGKVIDEAHVNQKPVISEESAFIMAHMMKGVVDRGTATIVKQLGRPVAGKTGTTNDEMDAWFVGYTPEWSAGVWVGFDTKRKIGYKETGGKVAAPIFLYFMQEFLKDQPVLDFEIPDGVIPVMVNVTSGRPTTPDDPGAFIEYFKIGTEPGANGEEELGEIPKDYLSNSEF